jgi:two-component system chemotaxis sensor kinase CheA
MNTKDDEFLRQLRATFRVEAVELLQVIATGLLKLDNMPPLEVQREIVETVFRAVHSLKGASRAVEFAAVESLCQSLEDVFASWKRQKSAPPLETLDTLHRALDAITAILASAEGTGVNYAYPDFPALRTALHKLGTPRPEPATHTPVATTPARFEFTSAETPVGHVPPAAAAEKNAAIRETVRVAVPKLESRMLEAEEMVFAKLAARQRVVDLGELADRFSAWRKAWTQIEPEARALRNTRATSAPGGRLDTFGLTQLLDFFDASLLTLKTLESQTAAFAKGAERDRYAVGKLVDDMLEDSKKLLLLPFAAISASLPKLVRDLCRDRGKMADLTVHGEDVEIDKRILEEMKDPLIHLLRNSIDHGIAPPDERIRRGKPARATITLTLSRVDGGKVQLLLTDDGAGVDTQKVKQSALDLGLIPAGTAEHLSEPEAQALIFQSEVSTSPLVTQLSGR